MLGALQERPCAMTDSDLSSGAIRRLLQTTQTAWAQAPAATKAVVEPLPCKLSSHRITVQRMAMNRPAPWGLQAASHPIRHS